jgi:acyl-CoA thioesterase-1
VAAKPPEGRIEPAMRYLALGDSYTIGTGASDASHSWPSIIARRLSVELTNPAVNGFTTLDLIRNELPLAQRLQPDFVTVLIGVNDLVQGRTADQYGKSLAMIYDELSGHVAAVSIPTWSYTPAAADFGGSDHVETLTRIFNDTAREQAAAHGFRWVDITEASTAGIGTEGWIAGDGLHPGDAQYAAWAETVWSAIRDEWARP